MGERWAKERGIPVRQFLPNWEDGRSAGIIRNLEMANYADALIAIWDGKSRGTRHMVEAARANELKVTVYRPNRIAATLEAILGVLQPPPISSPQPA